jgi:hypothetical protein
VAKLTEFYLQISGKYSTTMEFDDVKKTPSHDFALVAADGDIYSGPRRFNDHGQKLLAG